jgi:NAD-dependent dihydropyrimidine dehydrogenase PreA subunit
MLFFFTGTGNSLYAAKAIADKGEEIIDMSDLYSQKECSFKVPEGENVGFVFPVYFYSLPDVTADFCSKLRLSGESYVYAVITCGGSIGGSGGLLHEILEKRGIRLNNVFELLMPDNAVLFYNIPGGKKAAERIENADKHIADIKKRIAVHESRIIKGGTTAKIGRSVYNLFKGTKKFYADNSCVGCGVCAKNCPVKAIEMKSGKPHWVKKVCTKCTACINRCPSKAIQYGKATIKRNRYVNPVLGGK